MKIGRIQISEEKKQTYFIIIHNKQVPHYYFECYSNFVHFSCGLVPDEDKLSKYT